MYTRHSFSCGVRLFSHSIYTNGVTCGAGLARGNKQYILNKEAHNSGKSVNESSREEDFSVCFLGVFPFCNFVLSTKLA